MSHRRAQSQDPTSYSRTAEWVEQHAHVRDEPKPRRRRDSERSLIPSYDTSVPSSSRLTGSTTLSRASGNSVRNEMAAYEARKQRPVVAPPPATPMVHSQSHRGYKAGEVLNSLTLDKYKAAPGSVLVQSPVEEGWPKSLSGRPPPSKAVKSSKPPPAFLRKRRPSDASQGGSQPQSQPQRASSRTRESKPLPPRPGSPGMVRKWTL
ncbi:hypothetical protein BDY19DRAFT_749773 [Irpex rosettiformis]|uniref:Uncharacterized protein n=1 Tax=Irpex rosettiformis TaxID=378272 RepID=A0ACB8U785_9APHY|nr:hypothetical protein BDY19DRAFT_749773 [Irpex rosettiformis]